MPSSPDDLPETGPESPAWAYPVASAVLAGLGAAALTAAGEPWTWLGIVALVLAAVLTLRLATSTAVRRARLRAAVAAARRRDADLDRLVTLQLPRALRAAADDAATEERREWADAEAAPSRARAVLDLATEAVRAERRRVESTRAAFLAMASRIQVMATEQQRGISSMEREHSEPEVLRGLLAADHATAQLARQAQTLRVLCGVWPGRQWNGPVPLEDVIGGAMSRIVGYLRVEVHCGVDAAITAQAAEAVIHALAELLDNATRYSPPSSEVQVTVRSVQSGAAIVVDDGGLGMPESALAQARETLDRAGDLTITQLGATPRLGLAAVGRLAHRYDFSVSLDAPSPYGGVRAVLLLPSSLLTAAPRPQTEPAVTLLRAVEDAAPAPAAESAERDPAADRAEDDPAVAAQDGPAEHARADAPSGRPARRRTPGGLPVRRGRRAGGAPHPERAAAAEPATAEPAAAEAGDAAPRESDPLIDAARAAERSAAIGAVQAASRRGRAELASTKRNRPEGDEPA